MFFWVNLIVVSYTFAADICTPYGVRVQLGKYYTIQQDMNDMINILYNTNASCPQTHATLNGRLYPVTQTQIINMSELYQGYKPNSSYFHEVNYTYVTYVQRIQIGSMYNRFFINQKEINAGELYEYTIYGNNEVKGPSIGSFKFIAPLKNIKDQTRAVFFGDMDSQWIQNNSKPTFDWFQKQSQVNQRAYDVVIYTGDMAYDLESDNCQRGDYFLRNFSTIAAYWPVMLTPGNHDTGNNTKYPIFRRTFHSLELNDINTQESFYNLYSFDIGLVHFIAFNPYKFIYGVANKSEMEIYYDALEKDLSKVNKQKTPWIVVYSHFPMMCSDVLTSQCQKNINTLSEFYTLFKRYGVQLYIAAHSHYYDRSMIEEDQSDRDTLNTIYFDKSPVYLVEGAAGNDQDWSETIYPKQDFTQFQYGKQSVGVMTVTNETHLQFEQVSTKDGLIVDQFFIIQGYRLLEKQKSNVWSFIFFGMLGVFAIVVIAFIMKYCTKEKKEKLATEEFEMQPDDRFVP